METILGRLEIGDLTRRFVMVVAENRRLFALPEMIRGYLAELARRRGEVTAQVVTASALSESQKTALNQALRTAVGSKVTLDLKVDASLIGGLIVRVGSRMVDSTLKTKLHKLQLAMKGAG